MENQKAKKIVFIGDAMCGKTSILQVFTKGQEDWYHIRRLIYTEAEVIVIVCSIDSRDSLENVRDYWSPEIKKFCRPGIPKLLVANKKDLRNVAKTNQFEYKEGEMMAKEIRAFTYLECSALRHEGIQDIFISTVKALKTPFYTTCDLL